MQILNPVSHLCPVVLTLHCALAVQIVSSTNVWQCMVVKKEVVAERNRIIVQNLSELHHILLLFSMLDDVVHNMSFPFTVLHFCFSKARLSYGRKFLVEKLPYQH